MENTHNAALKAKLAYYGMTQKQISAEMGINARVFSNKLHRRMVNGREIRFTEKQKAWLAERFSLDINEID